MDARRTPEIVKKKDSGVFERCQKCQNIFMVLWVIDSRQFRDFGIRHCPFCGLQTDETGSVVP